MQRKKAVVGADVDKQRRAFAHFCKQASRIRLICVAQVMPFKARRYVHFELYVPGLYQPQRRWIVIGVDDTLSLTSADDG